MVIAAVLLDICSDVFTLGRNMRTNVAGKPFDRNESASCFKRRPAPIYICVLVISLSVRLKWL